MDFLIPIILFNQVGLDFGRQKSSRTSYRISLGAYTLFVALAIASVKVVLVSTFFMHLKFSDVMFKIFVGIVVLTLFVIFLLTYLDYLYR